MWFIAWVGCGGGVEGHLVSSTGTPLASVAYRTGGDLSSTASDGAYDAAEGAAVAFDYGGVEYLARAARAEPFHVPSVRKVDVTCPSDAVCDLVLDFGEHDGLLAVVRHACEPGLRFPLDAPNHEPAGSCAAGRALFVDARTESIALLPVGRSVEVTLDGDPAGCDVWVDSVPLKPAEGNRFTGQALGAAWAGGRCGGRPLAPVSIPRDADRATLVVHATGPDLSLAEQAPWAREIVVTDPAGWSVNVRPTESGTFPLPVLSVGAYHLEIRGEHPRAGSTTSFPVPSPTPGLRLMPGGPELLLGSWSTDGTAAPVVVVP